jgi:hypothetical protein
LCDLRCATCAIGQFEFACARVGAMVATRIAVAAFTVPARRIMAAVVVCTTAILACALTRCCYFACMLSQLVVVVFYTASVSGTARCISVATFKIHARVEKLLLLVSTCNLSLP